MPIIHIFSLISYRRMHTLLLSTFVNCFFIVNCFVISYQVLPLSPFPVESGLAKWAGELSNLGTVRVEVQAMLCRFIVNCFFQVID